MSEIDAWMGRPRTDVLQLLGEAPNWVEELTNAASDDVVHARRDGEWAPVEVVCHLRDMEELALGRHRQMLQMDAPMLPSPMDPADTRHWGLIEEGAHLVDPARWAEDRQYLRHDIRVAITSFTRWRAQTLAFLQLLTAAQWRRVGVHPVLGPCTYDQWNGVLAYHDALHVAQLADALTAR